MGKVCSEIVLKWKVGHIGDAPLLPVASTTYCIKIGWTSVMLRITLNSYDGTFWLDCWALLGILIGERISKIRNRLHKMSACRFVNTNSICSAEIMYRRCTIIFGNCMHQHTLDFCEDVCFKCERHPFT